MKKLVSAIIVLAALTFGAACERGQDLKRLALAEQIQLRDYPTGTAHVSFCTLEPESIRALRKILFVIDRSGSNVSGNGPSQPASDPSRTRRFPPILDFLDMAPQDSSSSFHYISFQDSGVSRSEPAGPGRFTSDLIAFRSIIASEMKSSSDYGATPYRAALNEVISLISADIQEAKKNGTGETSSYIVFFISDGYPTDTDAAQAVAQIQGGLMPLAAANSDIVDFIQLHTGFYYGGKSGSGEAASVLRQMAAAGNGDFIEFTQNEKIDFSKFNIPDRKIAVSFQDIFVSNASTIWEDGVLQRDSDLDGISDETERRLGSDEFAADSDRNGLSDGVELATYGSPCGDPGCRPDAVDTRKLATCERFKIPSTDGWTMRDSDRDGLNDCEEHALGSRYEKKTDFDSNKDWIPDWLAFRSRTGLLPSAGNTAILDQDQDGYINYNEVKHNTPADYPNHKLTALRPYQYKTLNISKVGSRTCYDMRVEDIALIGSENVIRVHLLENTVVSRDLRFMRVAEKMLEHTDSVSFAPEDCRLIPAPPQFPNRMDHDWRNQAGSFSGSSNSRKPNGCARFSRNAGFPLSWSAIRAPVRLADALSRSRRTSWSPTFPKSASSCRKSGFACTTALNTIQACPMKCTILRSPRPVARHAPPSSRPNRRPARNAAWSFQAEALELKSLFDSPRDPRNGSPSRREVFQRPFCPPLLRERSRGQEGSS